ncbi:MAG: DegT/DnrJ/EryC1/StrS family aminotransferase [Acidimicrobiaceae bacterium]|nr:DegT/DnrJ/EryC1/StrS family aminotransferase [Acidimicrobiaceae bacterium]
MRVPFFKYADMFAMYADEYRVAMDVVLNRGAFILQSENREFDQNLAKYVGSKYAYGVGNGTDAIIIALRAAGVGQGDEVILPSHTYIATAASVHFAGATPVLVECGTDHLIDPEAIESAITSRSKCILPVQLNGRTANMEAIEQIAKKHGLVIVEDAAQGVGSSFKGRAAGTFGIAGTYSFFPAKILGSFGDAGAIVTNDEKIGQRISLLRDHGRNEEGNVVAWGLNSRLDNLQAAVLLTRMKHLDKEIARRREIASMYQEGLQGISELLLPPGPNASPDHFDSYQNYEIEAERRDDLKKFLLDNGVGTLIQWNGSPIHWFKDLGFNVNLPITDELFKRCLLLPINSMLTNLEVEIVIEEVRRFYRS